VLTPFNKTDLLPPRSKLPAMLRSIHESAHCVSGLTGEGIPGLKQAIRDHFEGFWKERELVLAYAQSDLLSGIYETGKVLSVEYEDDRIIVRFKAPDAEFGRLSAALDGGGRVATPRPLVWRAAGGAARSARR
jgi:50S ribosomal subunit-associated GTPase HflX